MKKSLLAVAVLSAFTGMSWAQSSVTLSGGVDLGVRRQNGDWDMNTAGSSRSNLTFSGTEDLGGGLRAFFLLNHRFNPDTGSVNYGGNNAASEPFFRNSWLGLGGGFGDVRLGRMLTPLQEFNGGFDPFGTDTVGSVHTGGPDTNVRVNNTIYYRTPSLGGLQLHASISAADDQDASATTTERPAGLALGYSAGPLSAALAWDRDTGDNKSIGLYGKYNFGVAAAMFQYEKIDGPGVGSALDDVKRWSVGATVPMGAATLKAGYGRWSDEEKKKLGLGVDYALSKRTTLYTDLGKRSGDGWTDDQKKTMFDVGVWHKF